MANLQALYGTSDSSGEGSDHPTSTVRPPGPTAIPPTPDGDLELCNDGSIDTIFNSAEGVTYVFKGNVWANFPVHMWIRFHAKQCIILRILRVRQLLRMLMCGGGLTGAYHWKLTEDGIASGYPKLISKSWPALPNDLDAAFTYKNGKTYFFKGSKYWKYAGKKMDGDYPKDINDGFTGIPDNIDGAMVWSGNGKIYFFKGTYT